MDFTGLSNNTNGKLKQRKIINWAPVDQATDKSSGPSQIKWIAIGRAIMESGDQSIGVRLKRAAKQSTLINN